jgi:6-pyruvoyltetrahydropterin/6-carboxytetrahydropterin synthase
MKVAVFRKEHFNAAHRLYNPSWSDERNREVFGKCSNTNFHGHNYDLVVRVSGVPDAETGYVMDMKVLSDIVRDQILDRFDHKNLNLDTEEFRELNPTAENIAAVIYRILRDHIDPKHELKVILYETERNYVECPAD